MCIQLFSSLSPGHDTTLELLALANNTQIVNISAVLRYAIFASFFPLLLFLRFSILLNTL